MSKIINMQNIERFLEIYKNDIDSDNQNEIISIFNQADIGDNKGSGAGDKQLSENEILNFLSKLKDNVADLFKRYFYGAHNKEKLYTLCGFKYNQENSINDEQIKTDLEKFDCYMDKYEYQMDSVRKDLFFKLRNLISNKTIVFENGLEEENHHSRINELEMLFNLKTTELNLMINKNIDQIIRQSCKGNIESYTADRIYKINSDIGITFEDAQNFVSNNNAYILLATNFLTDEQYSKIIKFINFDNAEESDYGSIESTLEELLTSEQRSILQTKEVIIRDIAKNIVKRGFYTKYVVRTIETYANNDRQVEQIMINGDKKIEAAGAKAVKYVPTNDNKENAGISFENTVLADINTDHNQILDVIEKYKNSGKKVPRTIINFDSHSDLHGKTSQNSKSIADWVNYAAAEEGVERVVWVIPQSSLDNNPDAYNLYFGDNDNANLAFRGNIDYTQIVDNNKPLIQKFYLDLNTKNLIPITQKPPENDYKVIEIATCTESNIPDFENEDVLLSVDGDYFNNCGFDTAYKVSNTPIDVNNKFEQFLSTLKNAHLKPAIASFTISPQYTSIARIGEVYGFFQYLIKNTPQEADVIKEYSLDKNHTVQEEGNMYKSKY